MQTFQALKGTHSGSHYDSGPRAVLTGVTDVQNAVC